MWNNLWMPNASLLLESSIGQHDSSSLKYVCHIDKCAWNILMESGREKKFSAKKDHKIHQIFILSTNQILFSVLNVVQMLVLSKYRSFYANRITANSIQFSSNFVSDLNEMVLFLSSLVLQCSHGELYIFILMTNPIFQTLQIELLSILYSNR